MYSQISPLGLPHLVPVYALVLGYVPSNLEHGTPKSMMVLGVHSTLGEKTNVLRFMLNEEVSMLMMGDM